MATGKVSASERLGAGWLEVSLELTLNLGVRREYGSPYSEQHDYLSN